MISDQGAREPSVSEIKSELQAILNSRGFRQSKGLCKLLRYLCSVAVVDDPEQISEYSIAVDVLGKPTEFKDSKDASVRVEVHRLRKRLAQYYEEEGAGRPFHIVIPTGNYAPQFVFLAPEPVMTAVAGAAPALETAPEISIEEEDRRALTPAALEPAATAQAIEEEPAPRPRTVIFRAATPRRFSNGALAVGAFAVAIAAAAGWLALRHRDDALDRFWGPVVSTPGDALLCVGNREGGIRAPSPVDFQALTLLRYHNLASQTMLVADATTLCNIAATLREKHKPYRVLSQSETTFHDLQTGPVVLVGLRNNDWTERLLGQLRYTVEEASPGRYWIRDRENPGNMAWQTDFSANYLGTQRDYALVLRVLDPKTERLVVAAAGISMFGTLAAGELLTNASEMRKLDARAPAGWKGKNVEAVLATDVIKGKTGHPEVVAAHFW